MQVGLAASSRNVNDLREAGVAVVASAGNEGYIDGISRPACTTGVLSVGAVYDANVCSRAWSVCTDATTAAFPAGLGPCRPGYWC